MARIFYCGKDIDTMDREELLAALKVALGSIQSLHASMEQRDALDDDEGVPL